LRQQLKLVGKICANLIGEALSRHTVPAEHAVNLHPFCIKLPSEMVGNIART
jgi:hypothetical protein